MEKEYCIITTACNKKEIADKIIEASLEKRLVCCCQVININSSYWWKGKIEREPEFFIQMKTKKTLFKEAEKEKQYYLNDIKADIKYYEKVYEKIENKFKINGKLPNEATDNLVKYIDIIKNRKEN